MYLTIKTDVDGILRLISEGVLSKEQVTKALLIEADLELGAHSQSSHDLEKRIAALESKEEGQPDPQAAVPVGYATQPEQPQSFL